jgi:hypothetical protein
MSFRLAGAKLKIQDRCQKTSLNSSSVNPDPAEQGHRSERGNFLSFDDAPAN